MAPIDLVDRRRQRSVPILLFAVVLALLIARVVVWRMEAAKGGATDLIHWIPATQAEMLAIQQHKRILFNFTAAWCVPCHQLEEAVFRNPRLAKMIDDRFVPVRIVDRQEEDGANDILVESLQRRYSVRAFPTLVFTDAEGNQQQRMEGFGGAERFEQVMEQVP
jgi:thiol:disulfide interchange protein DsbD